MMRQLAFLLATVTMVATSHAAVDYQGSSADPGTGDLAAGDEAQATWDALGGGWDHVNGSDAWDGTAIGTGSPGGASALVEGNTDYLRIQDTGDPRDYGMADPSNRKVWFAHEIDHGLDGARLQIRTRIATEAPLDDLHPDGGAGVSAWPAGGVGYQVRDDGKGMFGIAEASVGSIGFALALQEELQGYSGYENIQSDVLLVNEYNSGDPTNVVTGATGVPSYIPIDDALAWHDFVVDITSLGGTDYQLSISVDGGPASLLNVTAGDGIEYENQNIVFMGSSGTGAVAAFDVDYFTAVPEPTAGLLSAIGALALLLIRRR